MTYPKGIMLYSDHKGTIVIPPGVDFVVAVAANKMIAEPQFNNHVQQAADANIPCIAMFDVDPDYFGKQFSLANPLWPTQDNDPYIRILDKLFLSPAKTLYTIHGIMLDIRTKGVAAPWVTATAQHYTAYLTDRYKLPVYILTDSNVLVDYPESNGAVQVYLEGVKNLCTHTPAPTETSDDLIPPPAKIAKPRPNWNGVKIWWYGTKGFSFLPGAAGAAPIMEYRSSVSGMHNDLHFTPRQVTNPTPPTTGEAMPSANGMGILELINAKLDYIIKKLG